jgi:hypothetical protein
MDTEVIEPELRPVAELLSRTLHCKASDVAIPPGAERVIEPRRQRPWATLAACVVIAVGAATALTIWAVAPDDRDRAVGNAPATSSPGDVAADEAIQWYLPEQIPEDYVLTDLRADPSARFVQMSLTPTGRGVGMLVLVSRTDPAFDVGDFDDVETIDGHEYAISEGDVTVSVTSVQGDVTLQVINAYDRATALAVATSVEPVSVDEAREASAAIDELLQGYSAVAAATLGDGTMVTVRRADGVDDVAIALCVEGANPTCQQPSAVADPGAPAHVAAVFDVGDQRRIVAWHETEGQLAFVGSIGDQRGEEGLPTELVPAHEGEGWFASTKLPDGDDDTIVSVGTDAELSYVVPGGSVTPT